LKAVVRTQGVPTAITNFHTRRDAADRARLTEAEMVRGVQIDRSGAERTQVDKPSDSADGGFYSAVK